MAKVEKRMSKPPQSPIPIPKSRRGLKGFFAEVGRELKKVNWPAPKENNRLTGVVLAVCGIAILYLTVLSQLFDFLVNVITTGKAN